MQKTFFHFIFLAVSCSFFITSQADECSSELDAEIEALLDSEVLELEAPVPAQTSCFPTCSILSLLTPKNVPSDNPPIINAVNILMEDLYKKTTGPVTRRSLLDEPALIPDYFSDRCWSLSGDIFFNYSPKVYFTKNSPFICSYINLTNQNIINEIDSVEFINADVPGVLGLFTNIKLYQYRVGLMASFARTWKNWVLTARIPLYYLLEHFYLTPDERRAIENNPFFKNEDGSEGAGPKQDVEAFALQHLVSDKFGVGDTRVSFLGHLHNSPCKNLWFGLQATLPTSKHFVRGLLGGEFNADAPIPRFNLQHFFNVFFCNGGNQTLANGVITRELTDFLVSALDRLSTILINTPLGNGKHFGLGPEFNFRYTFNDYFSTHTYATLEGYMPHHETRYFLVDKQATDFDRNWRDPNNCGENLALLNRLIVTTLFPVAIRTDIYPGLRFQINQALMYKSKHWDLKFGFDYWIQASEKFSLVAPQIPVDLPLVINKARRPAASQGKLFFNGGYFGTLCDNVDFRVLLSVDGTVFHKGIGENYTGSLRLGIEF